MEIKSKFDHFNINVTNLERSIAFYEKALGLKEHHRKEASDGSFTLVYLTDNETGFLLELTWLKDHTAPYELGENESHLCFRVAGDYDAIEKADSYTLKLYAPNQTTPSAVIECKKMPSQTTPQAGQPRTYVGEIVKLLMKK